VPRGCHMEVPTGLRQLRQQPIADSAEGEWWSLQSVGAGADLAALDVLPQTSIDILATLAALPDLLLEVAVAHDRFTSVIFQPGGWSGNSATVPVGARSKRSATW